MMATKLFAVLALYVGIFAVHIGMMILGWGLQPRSWAWIAVLFIVNTILIAFSTAMSKEWKRRE